MKQKQNDCKGTGLALLLKYILQIIGHFNMRPHHFVQVFANIYLSLLFLLLESLNDLHINTVSRQQGYSNDIAIYIENYRKYETILFGLIQWLNQSSKSHLHFRLSKQFTHNNQV